MIPDSILEDVRARADIVEVIGQAVPLKRAGKDFRALCPFHHEKTPSFYVVPEKGFYKCFGCGESGDVFTFLMKRNGITFIEAVREVAGKVGIEIPEQTQGAAADEPHRALFEAIAFAVDYYIEALGGPAGSGAWRYLEGRGITKATAERFQLGYAPDAWRELREAAHRHGIEDETLLAAGLIKESERSEEPYDRFRDRIIFPVAEVSGRVIAFGGRALRRAENVPKYLNSPETAIYHKSMILYGLNWSRSAIRREGAALVVEGYMDYVSLAAGGIDNVVAGMGTALTVEQANLVARYTAKAYLLYDSDTAGLKATFRSADALLRAGVHPLVVTLPAGEDPDSVVRLAGAEALKERIDQASDVLDKKLQMLDERGYFGDSDGKRRALDRLLPTIRATIDPALRDIYIGRVAERTGVKRETLEHEMESGTAWGPGRWRAAQRDAQPPRPEAGTESALKEVAAERLFLLLLMRDPTRTEQASRRVRPEAILDPANRELYEALLARGATEEAGVRQLFGRLDGLDRRMLGAGDDVERGAILEERVGVWRELRNRGVVEGLGFKVSRRYRKLSRESATRQGKPTTEER